MEKSQFDDDTIHLELGRHIAMFQWLENKLVEIATLILDPNWTGTARAVLTGMSFRKLLTTTEVLVTQFTESLTVDGAEDFRESFHALMKDALKAAEQRNKLVHSTYIEIKGGGEIVALLRSKGRLRTGGSLGPRHEFDQQFVTPESFEEPNTKLAETAFGVSQAHLQLIHWMPHTSADSTGNSP